MESVAAGVKEGVAGFKDGFTALHHSVIASSGTIEQTAKMLKLMTSSLVDAEKLDQDHFPFAAVNAMDGIAANKLRLLQLITQWYDASANDKRPATVGQVWKAMNGETQFPTVERIRRHSAKGAVDLVDVKDLSVVHDQQCAESVCLDHLLAIMAILAGHGVFIHDVHTVELNAKHKKRPDIAVSNQSHQAILGASSALIGEVKTLKEYGKAAHVNQAAGYITLTLQGGPKLPAFGALLLTWNKVALLKGTRADQEVKGWRSMSYDIGFQANGPSPGLRLLAEVLAQPPRQQDLAPSFDFQFVSASDSTTRLPLSFGAVRTCAGKSIIFDVSIEGKDDSAVAKKVNKKEYYQNELVALNALRGVNGLVTLLGWDEANSSLLISPQCARHLREKDSHVDSFKPNIATLLEALQAVHDRSWLHNDICPANILVSADAQPRLLLADFGLATALDTTGVCELDKFIGRYPYAADSVLRAKGGRTSYSRMTDLESLVKTVFALRHPSFVLSGPVEGDHFDHYLQVWDRAVIRIQALGQALVAARAGSYDFATLVNAWW